MVEAEHRLEAVGVRPRDRRVGVGFEVVRPRPRWAVTQREREEAAGREQLGEARDRDRPLRVVEVLPDAVAEDRIEATVFLIELRELRKRIRDPADPVRPEPALADLAERGGRLDRDDLVATRVERGRVAPGAGAGIEDARGCWKREITPWESPFGNRTSSPASPPARGIRP